MHRYDVIDALVALASLEVMSFLPGFISAVVYTTLGSYTWYWACIAGTNVGCCLIWIKLLVLMMLVNILIQVVDIYGDDCNVVVSEATTVATDAEEPCESSSAVKMLRFIFLLATCVPNAALFYFGTRAYSRGSSTGRSPRTEW